MLYKGIFLICATLSLVLGKSVYQDEPNERAMEHPDLFEGDIVGYDPGDRSAVVGKDSTWPNGRIPYVISPELRYYTQIKDVMDYIANKTCIRFVPRTNERNYVRIYEGHGCFSYLGYRNFEDQPLSLGDGCRVFGIILHEMGHTIGFHHEHNRSDRDDYLTIHYENISKGNERQFEKVPPNQNRLLTPFDFDSIMIYGPTVFSKNAYAGLKTITAKDGRSWKSSAYKNGFSKNDIVKINKLYNC